MPSLNNSYIAVIEDGRGSLIPVETADLVVKQKIGSFTIAEEKMLTESDTIYDNDSVLRQMLDKYIRVNSFSDSIKISTLKNGEKSLIIISPGNYIPH